MVRPSICCSVSIIGVKFDSVRQACEALGMSHANVIGKCRSNDLRYSQWVVLSDTAKHTTPTPKPVCVGNIRYASYMEAGRALRLSRTTVRYRCLNQMTVDGIYYTVALPRKKT